ncbi:MAG: aldo/keto reductase [Alphaproteobacteria bacterium]|nr:aldo/keto reductase [Alphaproteobacteria bacterium]
MKQRVLGKTGFSVGEIGHGLWGMGGWTDADDKISHIALRLSVEGGCSFFDSAFAYGNGHSDRLAGELVREYPHRPLVLASKIPPANWKWPSSPTMPLSEVFPRSHVLEYAERIQRSFGRAIDLLQFHVWEDVWAHEAEWQDTIAELKAKGVIKAFGLSVNRWQPENGIAAIETGFVDAVQVIYNVFDQAPEDSLFPVCRARNIGVIARVPFDEGSLGGKMTASTRFPKDDWRSRYFGPENLPQTIARVEALKKAVPKGMSLPEVALRFILSEPTVSTVIAGMRASEHVRANLAASKKGPLPADLVAKLRAHRWDRKPAAWSD